MEYRLDVDFVNTEVLMVCPSLLANRIERKFAYFSICHTKILKQNNSQNMS